MWWARWWSRGGAGGCPIRRSKPFERAKASGDDSQMASLDFAYRREQLYFEILLDVRDAIERR